MQEMKKAGVIATNRYYRGHPQIIKLNMEYMEEPKVKISPALMKETVLYKGKQHVQFNSMYVCTLTRWPASGTASLCRHKEERFVDFGFLGSQNTSASIDRGGGDGDG